MFKNILVSVDFDNDTDRIVEYAKEMALKFDAKVWVLHVAAPEPDFVGYEVGPQYIRDFRAEELRDEHRKLQEIAHQLANQNIPSEGLMIAGATTKMIVEECEKLAIDLICIGHKKHNWLHEILESHTDFNIINHVKIPVLTIPVSS